MNNEPTYSYDKEADVLYISFSPGEKATSAVELNDNILVVLHKVVPQRALQKVIPPAR